MSTDTDPTVVDLIEGLDDESSSTQPDPGTALCLSGGGYRAMLFHVGALWRLYETKQLKSLKRISSVSGGSITAALLGLQWSRLSFDPAQLNNDFHPQVVEPIRRLARETIDISAGLTGLLWFGSIAERVAGAFREHLYGDATLQDLPNDPPRFVINATNVQSGALWRFMKPYMRDYRVGEVKQPRVSLATAVAASSAFPPFLSPLTLNLDPDSFTPNTGLDLQIPPYNEEVVLSDGGVYDNLGLETVWKRYDTILVSDAGGKMQADADPETDWARHSKRVLDIIDNQVRSLRYRQLIESYRQKRRQGAYWGIRTDIVDYGLPNSLPCPFAQTTELARTPTRLKALPNRHQERLINWGYAVCDAALRSYVDPELATPAAFPYRDAEV